MNTVDGFTDTYEFSKASIDDRPEGGIGFALKSITDIDDFEKAVEGGLDYLDGNESYAALYYRGQLFANDIIPMNQIDGMENFLDDVWAKIKQFFKWLASKFTGKDTKTLTTEKANGVKVNNVPANTKLKENAIKEITEKFKRIETQVKDLKPKIVPKNAELLKKSLELKEKHPECYSSLEYENEEAFEKAFDNLIDSAEKLVEKVQTIASAQALCSFLNSECKMFWNSLIGLYNKRIRVKGILMISGFNQSTYASIVEKEAKLCKDEKAIPQVAKNLMDVVSFNLTCQYLATIADELENMYAKPEKYFQP